MEKFNYHRRINRHRVDFSIQLFPIRLWGSGSAEETLDKISAQEYTSQLEENLIQIISHIDGAGEAKVMITLRNRSGDQICYAGKKQYGIQRGQKPPVPREVSYIIVRDANGSERALAVTEVQPTVKGVVVVCPGGEEPVVQQRIISAVTTALDIFKTCLCHTISIIQN